MAGESAPFEQIRRLDAVLRRDGFSAHPGTDALGGKVTTPFTSDQAESLNGYQHSLAGHPYTCPRDHDDVQSVLVAQDNGWHCGHPDCGYTQDWAFRYMADWSWKPADEATRTALAGKPDPATELDLGLPPREEPAVRRYRKCPVVIEAVRLTEGNAVAVADWVSDHGTHCDQFPERLLIGTLEGEMSAPAGWWVIRGVAGEFYPCEPGIFDQTYEPADDEPGSLFPGLPKPPLAGVISREKAGAAIGEALAASGVVLVSRDDLREVLRMACNGPEAMPVSPEEDAVLGRLEAAARSAPRSPEGHRGAISDAGAVSSGPGGPAGALSDAKTAERES